MVPVFVLVGGWPASGRTTLSRALAADAGLPLLAKDAVKEAIAAVLGRPGTVEESRRLGRAAVHTVLEMARSCPGAVLDSTWYDYSRPLVQRLPGTLVEVRCLVPREVARARYRARAAMRDRAHLDAARSEDELWGEPVSPLGVGPLIEVDTSADVDTRSLVRQIMAVAGAS